MPVSKSISNLASAKAQNPVNNDDDFKKQVQNQNHWKEKRSWTDFFPAKLALSTFCTLSRAEYLGRHFPTVAQV